MKGNRGIIDSVMVNAREDSDELFLHDSQVPERQIRLVQLMLVQLHLDDAAHDLSEMIRRWVTSNPARGLYRISQHDDGRLLGPRTRARIDEIAG